MASHNVNNPQNGRIQYIQNHGTRFIRPSGPVIRGAVSTPTVNPQDLATKCQNFLDTLVQLADDKGPEVGTRVRNLVNQLIKDELQPDKFGALISSTVIGSRPQPGLVPFLQKSLPCLRKFPRPVNGSTRVNAPHPSGSNRNDLMSNLPSGYSGPLPGDGVRTLQTSQTSTSASNSNFMLPQTIKVSNSTTSQAISSGHSNLQLNVQSRLSQHDSPSPGPGFYRSPAPNGQHASPVILPPPANCDLRRHVQQKIISVPRNQSPRPPNVNNHNVVAREDDGIVEDINDVTSQTGINLNEEANFLTEDNLVPLNQLPRAPSRPCFITSTSVLSSKIRNMASNYQFEEPVSPKVADLIALSCQRYLKTLVEKLGTAAQHRSEVLRQESRYEVGNDVKKQLKFFQEIEIAELQKKKEAERENLVKTAKSRSKNEDPDEQQKAKRKVREMEMASTEKLTASQTNAAAIHALDDVGVPPRKRMALDNQEQPSSLRDHRNPTNRGMNSSWTPRRVVNLKDALVVFEQEKTIRSSLLYEAFMKL